MNGLADVRQNYDRAYPHGLGIFIREVIADGQLDRLPAVSLLASINLPNPAGASYFYALLTAIEPSAYAATALNAMLGALVAVIAFDVARRVCGTRAAIAAGLLASVSIWASWVARGAWLQGPIEAMSALAAWLIVNGLTRRASRHVLAAFAWIAASMQTYLVVFGLGAQATAACLAAGRGVTSAPFLRRAAMAGLVVCGVSALAYAGAAVGAGAAPGALIGSWRAADAEARSVELNLDPINHVLRIASGRDFENTFVESDTPLFEARDRWSDARATAVDALMLAGIAMVVAQAVGRPIVGLSPTGALAGEDRSLASRVLLAWLALPVAGTFLVANAVMRDWKVHVFYLLLTSPAPYVLAGAPFALIEGLARKAALPARGALAGGLVVAGAAAVAIPWWNARGEIEANMRFPYNHDGLYSLPMVWQMRLAEHWRALGCATLHAPEDARWLASLLGSARPVRSEEVRVRGSSVIWQVQPQGNNCALLMAEAPAPAHAEKFTVALPGQKRTDRTPVALAFHRSLPVAAPADDALTVNLGEGWRLLALDAPASARAGETITVTHQWLVGMPPGKPHWAWYFAPFVKLYSPGERMLVQIDDAPAILGHAWRTGHVQISAVRFALPADLPAGDYALEMSLFDPNQKKNAVYFDPRWPDRPVVTIRRAMHVFTGD